MIFNSPSANNIIGVQRPAPAISFLAINGISTNGTGTIIQGNLIGTDVTGTNKVLNIHGIVAIGSDMLIGGVTAGARERNLRQ